jgi:signal peptidase II
MKIKFRDYSSMILIAGSIIVLDRITKWVIDTYLAVGGTWLPSSLQWLMPYARIVNITNKGAAFGMFQGMRIVFIILTLVAIGAIIYFYSIQSSRDRWIKIALCLLLGGAIGNFIDRVLFGQVTDFISVGTFAVFNVADSFVTISSVMLIIAMLIKEMQEKKTARQPGIEEENSVIINNDGGNDL